MSKATITKSLVCAMALAASLPLAAETETIGEYTWTYYIHGDTAGISLAKNSRAVSPLPMRSLVAAA